MKIAKIFFLVALASCSRAATQNTTDAASPNPVNSGVILDAGNLAIDAAAAIREDCAEPKKLTQLVTLNEEAQFAGESLESAAHAYDPETGVAHDVGPRPIVKPTAITPSRYAGVVDGLGLIWKDQDMGATVEDIATHKTILKIDGCAAGGGWRYFLSSTGRFLICDSTRGGQTLWDLRAPHPSAEKVVTWGSSGNVADEGLFLSPSDSYAIAVPVITWGPSLPSRDSITYFDLDAHTSKALAKAKLGDPTVAEENPARYEVAFCGNGVLFVSSGEKEIVVYRGRDGARLAVAPAMKGGLVSFSSSGKYVSQTRKQKTTVFRLDL